MLPPKYSFKSLSKKDIPLLFKWTTNPHVAWWWQQSCDWTEFVEKYQGYIESDHVHPFIMQVDKKAVGYIQYYYIDKLDSQWPDELFLIKTGIVGIDLFIGEPDYLAKGHGTKLMSEFIKKLWKNPEVNKIIVDPCPENIQAVSCFKKLRFKEIGQVNSQHGVVVIMGLDRP